MTSLIEHCTEVRFARFLSDGFNKIHSFCNSPAQKSCFHQLMSVLAGLESFGEENLVSIN
jgi:hypothetical protein